MVMKVNNPTHFWVIDGGQQADGTAGAKTLMCVGRSYHPLDHILPAPAEDMIDDIGEQLDDDAETWHQNRRSFQMTKPGLQKF